MSRHETDPEAAQTADARRPGAAAPPPRPPRALSRRAALLLAAAMLAVGVGVGAAIGPAPSASFAGVSPDVLARLPELLASIAGRERSAAASQQQSTAAEGQPQAEAAARRRRARRRRRAAALAQSGAEASPSAAGEAQSSTPAAKKKPASKSAQLPAVSSVWLIELSGESFAQAAGEPAAAPYIEGTLLHEGALLAGWSALQGSALASEAALLASLSEGAKPPCPEGAAGAACSTPAGALSAADTFAKEVLAQITASAAYREHGLVVVTFATVGVASELGLPAGASSATLTQKPPAGVLVLSPFAKAGTRPALRFDPTSPSQSLAALLG
jgi:hypothetical protein